MNNTIHKIDWKIYFAILILFIIVVCLIITILNFKVQNTLDGILFVDGRKNFKISFQTSNPNLLNYQKDMFLKIENYEFLIKNISMDYLGENVFILKFDNEKIYEIVKEKSFYNVQLIVGSKRIIDVLFNF